MSRKDEFDRNVAGLVGLRIRGVEYWDVFDVGAEPSEWDHGDWHHAVMGVSLSTDAGPVSVLWTDTLFPYGVEAFDREITTFFAAGAEGPVSWPVTDHPEWSSRVGQSVLAAETLWTRLRGEGFGRRARVVLPVAIRLDFSAGPVWFVAGIPTDDGGVSVPGDEIMVVLTSEAMVRLGFTADAFVDPASPPRRSPTRSWRLQR